jgi:hypothetical protein
MLPARYEKFSRLSVQSAKEQTEQFINGCKIYGRFRRTLQILKDDVFITSKFMAVKYFKNISEDLKILYSIFIELI